MESSAAPAEPPRRNRGGRPSATLILHPAQEAELATRRLRVGAAPTELHAPLPFSVIDLRRRIYCRYYDLCLTTAAAHGWASWSCTSCSVHDEISVAERREEALRICVAIRNART